MFNKKILYVMLCGALHLFDPTATYAAEASPAPLTTPDAGSTPTLETPAALPALPTSTPETPAALPTLPTAESTPALPSALPALSGSAPALPAVGTSPSATSTPAAATPVTPGVTPALPTAPTASGTDNSAIPSAATSATPGLLPSTTPQASPDNNGSGYLSTSDPQLKAIEEEIAKFKAMEESAKDDGELRKGLKISRERLEVGRMVMLLAYADRNVIIAKHNLAIAKKDKRVLKKQLLAEQNQLASAVLSFRKTNHTQKTASKSEEHKKPTPSEEEASVQEPSSVTPEKSHKESSDKESSETSSSKSIMAAKPDSESNKSDAAAAA